jgi:hypothetical protein
LGWPDPDGAILEPAAQLLAAGLRILGKPRVQVGDPGADLLDARQAQRLVRCPLEVGQCLTLLPRERLQVVQGETTYSERSPVAMKSTRPRIFSSFRASRSRRSRSSADSLLE